MVFGRAVITFSGFNLPYAGQAPHQHSILRKMGSSEHFGGKFGSGGTKIHRQFLFLFAHYAWTGISFVHMKDGAALNAPVDG